MRKLIVLLLVIASITAAWAGDVTLAWDPNTESDLAGYKLHYGPAPRTYIYSINVGNVTTRTLTGLPPGTYFIAATAYNAVGLESGYSNEVSITLTPPQVTFEITSQSASLRWFGVVLLATTSENASAVFRYKKVGTTQWSTVIATPTPHKTEHRVVLYFDPGVAYYGYEWTATSASGTVVVGAGTFQMR